ncbi:hypothetical protein EGT07_12905 [Herbaspirillum sp. HC18]|nr:hypothetical protein EGT07_12905 [Herbaspirillum sp. HC18]
MPLFFPRMPNVRSLFRRNDPENAGAPATTAVPDSRASATARSREATGREAAAGRSRFLSTVLRGPGAYRPGDADSGFSKASTDYIQRVAPGLHRQMEELRQVGWQVMERHLEHGRASLLRGRKIEIDPRVAHGRRSRSEKADGVAIYTGNRVFRGSKSAYLCELAHQIGCAMHREHISLQTKEDFVQGSLLREASGVWNELQTRSDILKRSGKDIWANRGPEFLALIAIHEQYYSFGSDPGDEAAARQQIAAALADMPVLGGKATYRQVFEQQYGVFQISDKTSPDVLAHVQGCFNETGVALPADQIAAQGHKEGGPYYWMTKDNLGRTLMEQSAGFRGKGIPDDDIGNSIMTAMTDGVSLPHRAGPEWRLHRYHDPRQGSDFQMWLKLGDKPGEIVEATVHKPVSALRPQVGQDADALEESLTQLVAALRLLVRQAADGNIQEFGMDPRPDAAPTPIGGIDEVLASSEGESLKAMLAGSGIDPHQFLATCVQPENRKRFSLENPGFGVYRANIDGVARTILARLENGQIADIRLPAELDKLFMSAPDLESRCHALQRDGWSITMGAIGGGTYSNRSKKKIVVDSAYAALDLGTPGLAHDMERDELMKIIAVTHICSLAHEIGHAFYREPFKVDSEKDYVASNALDEGEALLSEFRLVDEMKDPMMKAGLMGMIETKYGDKAPFDIYKQWKVDREKASSPAEADSADLKARTAYGEMYKKYWPTGLPDGVTYETQWRNSYRQGYGEQRRDVLIERLKNQIPPVQIWEASERSSAPSFNNIEFIHPLPKLSDTNLPESIYIPKDVFHRKAKGVGDIDVFLHAVRDALSYGEFDLVDNANSSSSSGAKTAAFSYKKQGQPHVVLLNFDKHGQVFDLKVAGPGFAADAGVMLSELAPHRLEDHEAAREESKNP